MKIAAQAMEMKALGEKIIDLSVGEPDFPTPDNIKNAAKSALDLNHTRYTLNQGTIELRNAIVKKLKNKNGVDYLPEETIVSAGAKQSIFNAVQSLVNDGDEVIYASPYYVSYPEMVTLANGRSVVIKTGEAQNFLLTPSQLEEAITPSSKLLILNYPCNPTGSCYTKNELSSIAEIVLKNNLYVISDEIYENLLYDDKEFVCFASLDGEIKKRTVVVNGFSKSYAMTGWRIGYGAGPANIISAMNKIQSHSTSNASSISQAAALEALNGPQSFIQEMRLEYAKRRDFIYEQLKSIEGVTSHKPAGAFYLLPNISNYFKRSHQLFRIENSFDLAMYLLHEAKVATVPGSSFGAEGYIRISYSTSMENLKEAAARIKYALGNLK
ncbi:MAG: aspartate aminotransferase [Ignavibacteriae bacterium HGW-Ignavibacteriae-3]|nr:MAG: aspartate aminotransferase [Ignavibacteriae bacterium HGW-Ignavibacteriae-3]